LIIEPVRRNQANYSNVNVEASRDKKLTRPPETMEFVIQSDTMLVLDKVSKMECRREERPYITGFSEKSYVGLTYVMDENGIYFLKSLSTITKYIKPAINPTKYVYGIVLENDVENRKILIRRTPTVYETYQTWRYAKDDKAGKIELNIPENARIIHMRAYDDNQLETDYADLKVGDEIGVSYIRKDWKNIYTNQAQVEEDDTPFDSSDIVKTITVNKVYKSPVIDRSTYFTGSVVAIDPVSNIFLIRSETNEQRFYFEPHREFVLYDGHLYTPAQLSISDRIAITYEPVSESVDEDYNDEYIEGLLNDGSGSESSSSVPDTSDTSDEPEPDIASEPDSGTETVETNAAPVNEKTTNTPGPPPLDVENNVIGITVLEKYYFPDFNTDQRTFGKLVNYSLPDKVFAIIDRKNIKRTFVFDEATTKLYWGSGKFPFEMLENGATLGVVYSYDSVDKDHLARRIDIH
ncbi:MAG: hypothetical protein KAS39_00045, partial [Actinomycetia bacterium]|nr:hypothetical protein [Actinomycetes bacterium]